MCRGIVKKKEKMKRRLGIAVPNKTFLCEEQGERAWPPTTNEISSCLLGLGSGSLKNQSFSIMVVSGHVVLALIWVTYDEQYPSQEMVQVRGGRHSVTRGVRMKHSNQGEIDRQHVGSDSSKAVAICRKGWDQKVRNDKRVLNLFSPEK
jgi:hypothetical protein